MNMVANFHHVPSASSFTAPQAVALVEALRRAIADRRRVDELVTLFDYDGRVEVEGQHFAGQGAVKRFFSEMLLDCQFTGLDMQSYSAAGDAADLDASIRLVLSSDVGRRELQLQVRFHGSQVSVLHVQQLVVPHDAPPIIRDAMSSSGQGPKWETYDGRVRQKIWQRTGLFEEGNRFIKDKMELTTGRLIAIVDRTVWHLYGSNIDRWALSVDLKLETIIIQGNEDHKTMDTFVLLLDELKRVDPLRRSEPVLAIGGGVLTDTAGFACACWRRGIPWCRLPTTLLGIVDASVGIKVAVNYHRKNGVGHFFSPSHTFIDTSFLTSVSTPDIRSGCGEIMKAALIHDVRLWRLMSEHGESLVAHKFQDSEAASLVIKLSIDAMLECIGPDLWEEALLRPMDFGHSFSRTLEADERFQLRHGEAVAIDCVMNSLIAEQKGLLCEDEIDALLALYVRLGLPCSIVGITAETYKRARDEITVHRDGLLRAPLPAGIGKCVYVDEMTDREIDLAFERLQTFMESHPQVLWSPSKSFNSALTHDTSAPLLATSPSHQGEAFH